jgi:homoserine dehydrogenase
VQSSDRRIYIGLMGMGVVGGGVVKFLWEKQDFIAAQAGCPLVLKKILVRDLTKKRSVEVPSSLFTTRAEDIITDPEISIVVEVIGGENPALEYIREALLRGKNVVTANKEVMAKHGPELLALAREKKVDLLYEASVGGGIPLIAPLQQELCANKISAVYAIINGTTNYILTRMSRDGLDFSPALWEAQELGYAEADPTNDIEGIDAAYKLAILASLAFHTVIRPPDVYYEGISRLNSRDFRYARELGYAIKLLAIAKEKDNSVEARVHPAFLPEDFLLSKVEGVYNAVQIEGDLVGKVLFYGEGAGALPTSSAVISDVISIAQNISRGTPSRAWTNFNQAKAIKPISEIETKYYLRMSVADRPGVLAQISRILGDHLISISSVIQKEADIKAQTAEIVIMTHPAQESAMRQALQEMELLPVVKEISNFVRVEA